MEKLTLYWLEDIGILGIHHGGAYIELHCGESMLDAADSRPFSLINVWDYEHNRMRDITEEQIEIAIREEVEALV